MDCVIEFYKLKAKRYQGRVSLDFVLDFAMSFLQNNEMPLNSENYQMQ